MPFFVSGTLLAMLGAVADDARAQATTERARADRLEADNAALRAERDTLVRQNGVHRDNAEWLKHLVNTLNQERAERVHLEVTRRGEEIYGDRIEALPGDKTTKVDPRKERIEQAVAEATSGNAIFDDMGDDAAAALGLEWDAAGGVVHTKR